MKLMTALNELLIVRNRVESFLRCLAFEFVVLWQSKCRKYPVVEEDCSSRSPSRPLFSETLSNTTLRRQSFDP